jgi:hypothetical protein
MQSSLFHFEPGRSPPRGGGDAEDLEAVSSLSPTRGRRCARCGKPLGRGGLYASGWGLLCWDCFTNKSLGRRDGRGDLSSDADGCRNSGYNLRR